ncbi:MAG: hypothetical protein HN509_04370 [Halobacteriovoraceae bacterium]|jgi:AhpD family alkylhydroperoxidase|nr:hypothetical protein [Halobacteriovoraceae bacterium]MBT5094852.1 hypothetical protein [Halobacteriovoraceae bacterium]
MTVEICAEEITKKINSERGGLANIHKSYLSFPVGMEAHFEFYKKIMLNVDLPLTRDEREWLAVETSRANKCPYCIGHHEKALENYSGELSEERKELLSTVAQTLTSEPWKAAVLKEKFLKQFEASAWAHALMVVGYFNMANRIAFGMDLELEDDFYKSCQ